MKPPRISITVREDSATSRRVPTTVPMAPPITRVAIRRTVSSGAPRRANWSPSMTMFGMISTRKAVLTSTMSVSSAVPRVGKPNPMEPLTKAAAATASARSRAGTREWYQRGGCAGGPGPAPVTSLASPAVLGTPRIGECAQGFQEDHQVGLLGRAEVQRVAGLAVPGAQAGGVETGVMPHDLSDRLGASVPTVGSGQHQVSQRRHLELADVAGLERYLTGPHAAGAGRVVVVRAQHVESALPQLPDTRGAPGIGLSERGKLREAGREELAIGEIGAGMARRAAGRADEELEPSPGRLGIDGW